MTEEQLFRIVRGEEEPYIRLNGRLLCHRVIVEVIYAGYLSNKNIKDEFENCLMRMLDGSDFDVYLAVLYIVAQLKEERRGKSPFAINRKRFLDRLAAVVPERKDAFNGVIKRPSGFSERYTWSDLVATKIYFRNKTGIDLFPDPYFDEDMDDAGFRSLLVGESCFFPISAAAGPAGVTAYDFVLREVVYERYKNNPAIKDQFERCLLSVLDGTDLEVFMVILYLCEQKKNERSGKSPFVIAAEEIIKKLDAEVYSRQGSFREGVVLLTGYKDVYVMSHIATYRRIFKREFCIDLFGSVYTNRYGIKADDLSDDRLIRILRGDERLEGMKDIPRKVGEMPPIEFVLRDLIYDLYEGGDKIIKEQFERCLYSMLDMTDYDVYVACIYLSIQFTDEKPIRNFAPYKLSSEGLLKKTQLELPKREQTIKAGVMFPSGSVYTGVWEEIIKIRDWLIKDCNIVLFDMTE